MSAKILVATHKRYNFPKSKLYIPIHVGKAISDHDFGYLGDDTNINISEKNQSFCELTALYWAWKNNFFEDADYCGLVHYRRYFMGKITYMDSKILDKDEIKNILKKQDIIVPKKRNYYIESVKKHYENAHYKKDLDEVRLIIEELTPEYVNTFDTFMAQKKLHLYNMFIMKKELFYDYCEWIFPLLFTLESRLDTTTYSSYQKRVYGFLAERLFNVWVLHHQLQYQENAISNIEGENMLAKAYGLLKRKINQRYKS